MTDEIRQIISEHGRLAVDVGDASPDDADLYQAGMTSHASVNVMLALEDAFDVEFPDAMLKRSVFESVAAIAEALDDARAGGERTRRMTRLAADRDAGLPRRRSAGSPTRSPRPTPTTSTATPASRSRRSTRCASERALSALVPLELGGGGVSFARDRRRLLRARPPLRRERDGLRHAPDPGRDASSATSTTRPCFEAYLREVAAEQRLIASVTSEVGTGGDMGRSIAARDPGRATAPSRFEKQAPTVSYGALRRRPAHHACAARPTPSPATRSSS